MSISWRKLAANRANSQKSTGPSSLEGKATVSQNRRKHGLTGSFQLLPTEDVEQFEELLAQFMLDEKPLGIAEVELVKTMAQHLWMSRRADCFQTACFLVEQTPEQAEHNQAKIDVRPELERYLRYQAHHDRAYQRASNDLLKRKKERLKAELGFESQKRAEAQEERREGGENRKLQRHKIAVAKDETQLERELIRTASLKAAAASSGQVAEMPKTEPFAA